MASAIAYKAITMAASGHWPMSTAPVMSGETENRRDGGRAPGAARETSPLSVRDVVQRPDSLAIVRAVTQMALAFCYTSWRVASTIGGGTTVAQLDEQLAAWGTTLSPELLAAIDKIRWVQRDPAQ